MRRKPQPPLESEVLDDVARACARFGIAGNRAGSRETRLLREMLKINREGRLAKTEELGRKADLNPAQVPCSLQSAMHRGEVIRVRAGHYVITEAGERALG